MRKIDFNQNWTVKCLTRDSEAEKINLPHDAMIKEPRLADSMGADNIGYYCGGDYVYTKHFEASEYSGKTLILEFESVYMEPEIFLNNEKIMYRPYGYTNFYVDLSGKLKDENELKVIAHNSTHPNSRWYSGTGIFRPVFIWASDEKHIDVNGIRVKTLSINPAVISVKVQTNAPGQVEIEIPGLKVKTSAEAVLCEAFTDIYSRTNDEIIKASDTAFVAEATIECQDALLWSLDEPNLYELTAKFESDVATTRFGIRTLTADENGICINGKREILRGACIHHDNGALGACTYKEAEYRKVKILRDNGYNSLRSAHNPCSKYLLDACDELGVLMMDEFADCWYIHKTKYDYVRYVKDWWMQDLKDMVDKDYNHPSVVMYSTGNEVAETSEKKGIELTQAYTDFLHSLDDTRYVSCGINIFFNFLYSAGMGVYSDDKADKPKDNEKKKAVGSEFYNLLACKLGDNFMKLGATLPMCDWKTKDAFAAMDVAGYNYGIYRYENDLKKYPNRLILGSETFAKDAFSFYELAKKHPRIVGDFVWAGMDYIGEAGMGSIDFSQYTYEEEETRMTGDNGRVDLNGIPRAEALYTKVAFEIEKGPYIAVLPSYGTKRPVYTGWKLTKAMDSWNWPGCEGKKAEIEIYARAAAVEVFINGRSLGRKPICKKDCRVVYKANYEMGTIKAVSYDSSGNVIAEKVLKSAGNDCILTAKPEVEEVKANGLVYLPIEYTDNEGIWKPTVIKTVKVEVTNGQLLGLSNAAPSTFGNYTDNSTQTYFARALAIVKADGNGDVKVTVSDDSQSREVTIKVN